MCDDEVIHLVGDWMDVGAEYLVFNQTTIRVAFIVVSGGIVVTLSLPRPHPHPENCRRLYFWYPFIHTLVAVNGCKITLDR